MMGKFRNRLIEAGACDERKPVGFPNCFSFFRDGRLVSLSVDVPSSVFEDRRNRASKV